MNKFILSNALITPSNAEKKLLPFLRINWASKHSHNLPGKKCGGDVLSAN